MTLQALRHPNVLQFLGATMMPPNLCMVRVCVVAEGEGKTVHHDHGE